MQALRVLDRFPPSEAYLLTLISAQHLEIIREEQLLSYLDRGLGVANRDARTSLLEGSLIRESEIAELDHFLERKLERGPRDFRAICRSMFTPAVERAMRGTRNEEARKLLLEPSTVPAPVANGSPPAIQYVVDEEAEFDPAAEREHSARSYPIIKVLIALGLLAGVAWVALDRDRPAFFPPAQGRAVPGDSFAPDAHNMRAVVRALCLVLGSQKDVIAQLKHDPYLSDAEREEALLYAQDNQGVSYLLNNSAWYAIRYAGITPRDCEHCLDIALEANRLAPTDGMILNTVGVAQYRAGKYKVAIDTLSQSYALNKQERLGLQPADVAFLCMAYAKQNRLPEAREQFAQLKSLLKLKIWRDDVESQFFFKEASEVMQKLDDKKGTVEL
jgi:hypothetical protein